MKVPNLSINFRREHMEHHPYITLNNGTEITYSSLKTDKNNKEYVTIYFETPSKKYGFCDASINYPGTEEFNEINHYTVHDLLEIIHHYNKIKDLVFEFAKEENGLCQTL